MIKYDGENMQKVVVTGATGFLGRALVCKLLEENVYVIAVCRNLELINMPKSDMLRYVLCNLEQITSLQDLIPDEDIDTFYHVSWSGVSGIERVDISVQLKNVFWTVDCLRAAKMIGCQRFIGVGSIAEYEAIMATYTQGSRPGLNYIYGGAKFFAYNAAKTLAESIKIDLIWTELVNVYGIGENEKGLICKTIKQVIQGIEPKFTNGDQNYDFIYIDDAVNALYLIGKKGRAFNQYLVGSSNPRRLKEFLIEMQTLIAPELKFVFGELKFTGVNLPIETFDCQQTEVETGFRAEVPFSEGIKRTVEWLKSLRI